MRIEEFLNAEEITDLAKKRFKEERATDHLEGWFLAKEIQRKCDAEYASDPDCIRIARTEVRVAQELPLWLSDYHIFAGTQDDAFARSYALINPSFRVEDFNGYCDPVAIFGDNSGRAADFKERHPQREGTHRGEQEQGDRSDETALLRCHGYFPGCLPYLCRTLCGSGT